ncbi:MAG: ABC transporter substrate-binding protein [Acidimicrobiia bacterium]
MMRRKRWLVATLAVVVLVLAACGSSGGSSSSGGSGSNGKWGGSVTIAVNPWDGSAANANVAKLILEKQGVTVALKDIDENAVWAGLDSGSIDANLEVWPSGHASDIATYIKQKKSVVDGGLLGPIGHIGWYIPDFVAQAHPEYKTWEGLKSQAAAKYFATAETGDKGQFLLGDPSYVSYDKDIIKNLNLPFQVVVGGSEATLLTTLAKAFQDKTPLLFYFYEPQWAQAKYKLDVVKLPAITQACKDSAAGQGKDGKYACDYPTDKLLKALSAKLKSKNPKVFAFFQKMHWTSQDQNTVTSYKNEDGLSMEAAAKKWVDANKATWEAWVK